MNEDKSSMKNYEAIEEAIFWVEKEHLAANLNHFYNTTMLFTEITAGPDDNDRRLDRILRKFMNADALSGIYSSIRKGLIKVNGKKAEAGMHVHEGDIIKIADFLLHGKSHDTEKKSESSEIQKTLPKLPEILAETEDILIINKPYDSTVQGFKNSLNITVEAYYKNKQKNSSISFVPGPLHRLDRKTSGALAFSMSLKGARWFSEAIKEHIIKKEYLGIVQGNLTSKEKWTDRIKSEFDESKAFQTVIIEENAADAKNAVTEIFPLGYGKYKNIDYTLVRFAIETGRKHQIRSQSSHHGFPLLGDTAYGGSKILEAEYFLHAFRLYVPKDNPISLPEVITAPIPKLFENFLKSTMHEYEKCAIL